MGEVPAQDWGMQGLGSPLLGFVLCQLQWEIINKLKSGSGKVKKLKVFAEVITPMTHDVRAG